MLYTNTIYNQQSRLTQWKAHGFSIKLTRLIPKTETFLCPTSGGQWSTFISSIPLYGHWLSTNSILYLSHENYYLLRVESVHCICNLTLHCTYLQVSSHSHMKSFSFLWQALSYCHLIYVLIWYLHLKDSEKNALLVKTVCLLKHWVQFTVWVVIATEVVI